MKKLLLIVFVMVLIGMSLWIYEKQRISRSLIPHVNYWVNSVQEARDSELSSTQFVEKYGDQADLVFLDERKAQLQQKIPIDSLLCNYAVYDIHYSFSSDGGSNLYGVSGSGCK